MANEETKYLKTVQEAIEYVATLKDRKIVDKLYQYKIAKLACEVCVIKHGGISKDNYTLSRFAHDIGFNQRSIQNWAQIYRCVIEKGGIEIENQSDWVAAMRVCNVLKNERNTINKLAGKKKGSRHAYKQEIPKEKVVEYFDSIKNDTKPFISELNSSIQSAKYIKHLMETRDLTIGDEGRLLQLMNVLDDASDLINNFLTKQKRQYH